MPLLWPSSFFKDNSSHRQCEHADIQKSVSRTVEFGRQRFKEGVMQYLRAVAGLAHSSIPSAYHAIRQVPSRTRWGNWNVSKDGKSRVPSRRSCGLFFSGLL
jgi:hypothetical protein